jgi:hypothetical protein
MTQSSSKHAQTPCPSVSVLWSLLWRAVVLTPFAAVFGVLWVAAKPLLFVLPICEVCYLWNGDWLFASIVAAVWLMLFLFTRSRWFKADRRDFPNEQENV